MLVRISLLPPKNQSQQSVNDFWSCIMQTQMVMLWCQPIIIVSAAFMGKIASDNIATNSWNWASTERQRLLVLHLKWSHGYAMAWTHNQTIGRLYQPKCQWWYHTRLLKLSGNRESTVFVGGSVSYAATTCTALIQNCVTNGQSLQYVFEFHFTNMHAMPHRSDFFLACSSTVNV